jgi:hypothetical protein
VASLGFIERLKEVKVPIYGDIVRDKTTFMGAKVSLYGDFWNL